MLAPSSQPHVLLQRAFDRGACLAADGDARDAIPIPHWRSREGIVAECRAWALPLGKVAQGRRYNAAHRLHPSVVAIRARLPGAAHDDYDGAILVRLGRVTMGHPRVTT